MFSEMVLPHVGTMNENQLILITLLGIKSLQRLVTHLEDLVSRYNGRVLEIENCEVTHDSVSLFSSRKSCN